MTASFPLSDQRCSIVYQFTGTEDAARANAQALCLDQTVEMAADLVARLPWADGSIVGRIDEFRPLRPGLSEARVSYPVELLGRSCAELLNVVFGISSLKAGIRVARMELSDTFLKAWSGPRFGRSGLRARLKVPDRPLLCGVLKPVGTAPRRLAELAYQGALGGLDLIKDDQGFADHPSCPFEERVSRCAEAVSRANRETGRNALYIAHVSGGPTAIRRQSRRAIEAGAGGLLLCPGLAGFDMMCELAEDARVAVPVLSHPALLGSFVIHPESGISPTVLFGQLPRLAGADVTLYPTFDGPYTVSREDCRLVAEATGEAWGPMKPIFPAAAGRITVDRMDDLGLCYGREVVFVLGSELYRRGSDMAATCREAMKIVEKIT